MQAKRVFGFKTQAGHLPGMGGIQSCGAPVVWLRKLIAIDWVVEKVGEV